MLSGRSAGGVIPTDWQPVRLGGTIGLYRLPDFFYAVDQGQRRTLGVGVVIPY
jgi:hypothetical protein